MRELEEWDKFGGCLDVPDCKLQEIKQHLSTPREKCDMLGECWVSSDADASWEKLARALYRMGEKRALAMAKQYLQQGMCGLGNYGLNYQVDVTILTLTVHV